jgi:transposase
MRHHRFTKPRRHWENPRSYDHTIYKQRYLIERCFNRLKQFRRFSTRYWKTSKPSVPAPRWAPRGSDFSYIVDTA